MSRNSHLIELADLMDDSWPAMPQDKYVVGHYALDQWRLNAIRAYRMFRHGEWPFEKAKQHVVEARTEAYSKLGFDADGKLLK